MNSILMKGVIRDGRVEIAEPINLPDGSEVTITGHADGKSPGLSDSDRPMTASEIAETLAAMDKVEPGLATEDLYAPAEFEWTRSRYRARKAVREYSEYTDADY